MSAQWYEIIILDLLIVFINVIISIVIQQFKLINPFLSIQKKHTKININLDNILVQLEELTEIIV